MTWSEFETKFHLRTADKCCENCKHGRDGYEGECSCEHPYVKDELAGRWMSDVCDLWERR